MIFVSSLFLGDVISFKSGDWMPFIYMGLMGVFYFFVLISAKRKMAIFKWLLSIPLSIPIWYWFLKCEFAIRALNWAIPGYGSWSLVSGVTVEILLMFLLGACGIALLVSIIAVPKLPEKIWRLQPVISIVITVAVIAAVLILERQFPSAEEVMRYIYS